ncbi:hypothetical protein [Gordonibacter sp. An230]|uniref:hypothetical protein n=1 Tax=Gordonibacter sp. An230 TaxID=1965592 RepID=UPI001EF6E6F3|nr:hypothetical protein [Gordonibacter sp. An230]
MPMIGPDREETRELARRRLEDRRARMRERQSPPRRKIARFDASALVEVASRTAERLGPKGLAALGAAFAAILALAVLAARGCSASYEPDSAPSPAPEPSVAPAPEPEPDPVDEAALAAILGGDLAASLVQAAESGGDEAWIAAHPEAFAVDGEAVQRKLLKLAAEEPLAVPFVRSFPDLYPAETADPCDAPAQGEVPRLYQ